MRTTDFSFDLPTDRIAQTPAEPRDSSRLMIVDRATRNVEHKRFRDILDYLGPNDLLVWNNSKVFKARLKGRIFLDEATDNIDDKTESRIHPTDVILNTKLVEIFLVRPTENHGVWKTLARPAKKLRLGYKIIFAPDFSCEVIVKEKDGTVLVQFADDSAVVREKANKYGEVPTPPYVNDQLSMSNDQLAKRYQTVYAKHEGSVAAPTAGFHFTPELIEKLKAKGVQFAEVTLHVGLGTFLPVKTERIEDHKMHNEWVEITPENAAIITNAREQGKRVVAVGTTSVRTLESVALFHGSDIVPFNGDVNIFITPGFKFQVVNALITNFHLPESTLLMLVSAFARDKDFVLKCYQEVINKNYRFYSFGDAMFII